MTTKWLGESLSNNRDKIGEVLVARYVHSGNPEYYPSSVDWATGIVTFTQPHGLTIGVAVVVAVCPISYPMDFPMRDIRSIPMEWIKPTNTTGSVAQTSGIALLPDTDTTAKVVRSSDSITAIPVNITSLENNGNVDVTKFRFENPIGWEIINLPRLRRMRVRSYGYVKLFHTTAGNYRYMHVTIACKDGTTQTFNTLGILGVNMNVNPYSAAGVFSMSDLTLDLTIQQFLMKFNGYHTGRRSGYSTIVADTVKETLTEVYSNYKDSYGATRVAASSIYACNGTIIEVYDMGGD